MTLQQVPLFAHVNSDELLQIGALTRVESFDRGDILSRTAETPLRVIRGTLTIERPVSGDEPQRAGSGDTVGIFEASASVPRADTGPDHVVATEAGAALRLERDDLFDLLGQRPALLQQLFAAIAPPEE